MTTLTPAVLLAHTRRATTTVQSLLGRGIAAEVASRWAADLPAAQARIQREATQVALVGHNPGDLARGFHAIYEAPVLSPDADLDHGRLLRIVHTSTEPELEEHTPDGAPWHWSTAHPDPVPPLRAQATGLQAERAALTREDQNVLREVGSWEQKVARMQQDVVNLSSAVGEAQRIADHAAHNREGEEKRLARALRGRKAVTDRLPAALAQHPKEGVKTLSAAVLAPFHPNTLDELAKEDASVDRARRALAAATAIWEDAEARVVDARGRLASHEAKLVEARRSLARAAKRRDILRARADQLSRKRLALAREMDDAAEAHRATMADDLAARLHGDPRGRLRLRWPHGGLGSTIIGLVAPGTHSPDPVSRRAAEDALATRADALLVCASVHDAPEPERARVIRRMARACPRVAVVFFDAPLDGGLVTEVHPEVREAWARALQLPPQRILAVALSVGGADPHEADDARQRARRQCEALGLSILDGPPLARAATVASAIRTTASRVDAEVRQQDQAHHQQLALLQAQCIDDPAAFALARRDDLARSLAPAAERARDAARSAVEQALARSLEELEQDLRGAPDAATFEALRQQLPVRIEGIWRDVDASGARTARLAEERAVDHLLDIALAPISERVRLTSRATRPPDGPPALESEESEAVEAVLSELRVGLDNTAGPSSTKAMLAGGALGAAILGPLGAVLGAGAGALAGRVSAGADKRCEDTLALVRHTFAEARTTLTARTLARLDGAEMRLATALDARLLPTLDQFMQWWADQRDEVQRRRSRAEVPLQQLRRVRDALVEQALELEAAIAQNTHRAGVVVSPAYQASLPPPPPPLV